MRGAHPAVTPLLPEVVIGVEPPPGILLRLREPPEAQRGVEHLLLFPRRGQDEPPVAHRQQRLVEFVRFGDDDARWFHRVPLAVVVVHLGPNVVAAVDVRERVGPVVPGPQVLKARRVLVLAVEAVGAELVEVVVPVPQVRRLLLLQPARAVLILHHVLQHVLGEGAFRGGGGPGRARADDHRLALLGGRVGAQPDLLRALRERRMALLVQAERRPADGAEAAWVWESV